jgi:hypothetical protein
MKKLKKRLPVRSKIRITFLGQDPSGGQKVISDFFTFVEMPGVIIPQNQTN